jgi:hypothetical protein
LLAVRDGRTLRAQSRARRISKRRGGAAREFAALVELIFVDKPD